jgi:hypothetical protein
MNLLEPKILIEQAEVLQLPMQGFRVILTGRGWGKTSVAQLIRDYEPEGAHIFAPPFAIRGSSQVRPQNTLRNEDTIRGMRHIVLDDCSADICLIAASYLNYLKSVTILMTPPTEQVRDLLNQRADVYRSYPSPLALQQRAKGLIAPDVFAREYEAL